MNIKSVLIILFMTILANVNAQQWTPVGNGIQSQFKDEFNTIYSLAVYKDELYAAGSFTEADGKTASFIAKWNGTTWSPVGE